MYFIFLERGLNRKNSREGSRISKVNREYRGSGGGVSLLGYGLAKAFAPGGGSPQGEQGEDCSSEGCNAMRVLRRNHQKINRREGKLKKRARIGLRG